MLHKIAMTIVGSGLFLGVQVFADWDRNPSFEIPYTNAWFSFTPAATTNSSEFARSGTHSLKFDTPDIPGDVPGSFTVVDSPHNTTSPGIVSTVSAYYYVDQSMKPLENLGVGIFWLKMNAGGTALNFSSIDPGGFTGLTGLETVGAWTRISHTGTAPADAEFLQVALEVRGDGSAIYFDQVLVNLDASLTLEQSGGSLVIDFNATGILQHTTNLVVGTWTDVDGGTVTNGPYVLPRPLKVEYFRVNQP